MQKLGIVINDLKDIDKLPTSNFDYIELSDHGFTPSLVMFETLKAKFNVPIYCMIKHPSNRYNLETIDEICDHAKMFIAHGADGLVCDFTNSDYSVNYMLVSKLRRYVKDKALIYHLNMCDMSDELRALQELIVIEAERVVFKSDINTYLRRIAKAYFEYHEVIDMALESNDLESLLKASEFTGINTIQLGNSK